VGANDAQSRSKVNFKEKKVLTRGKSMRLFEGGGMVVFGTINEWQGSGKGAGQKKRQRITKPGKKVTESRKT